MFCYHSIFVLQVKETAWIFVTQCASGKASGVIKKKSVSTVKCLNECHILELCIHPTKTIWVNVPSPICSHLHVNYLKNDDIFARFILAHSKKNIAIVQTFMSNIIIKFIKLFDGYCWNRCSQTEIPCNFLVNWLKRPQTISMSLHPFFARCTKKIRQ